jgi:hypothetical protein
MNSFRESLFQIPASPLVAIVFFAIILAMNWLGYTIHKRIVRQYPDKEVELGTSEGSLLGLMALLLAFSFSMAASKFESRRQTIVDEANLLNTAILRCYLYPDSIKQSFLPSYKKYVESRINYYNAEDNPAKIKAALGDANKQFLSMWNNTILLSRNKDNRLLTEQSAQVLINLKNMLITRESGRINTVPSLIIMVLLILVVLASFLAGYGTKPGNRSAFLSVAFALMTSIVLYLVMELNRPRQGFVNLNSTEQNIVDLRRMFP